MLLGLIHMLLSLELVSRRKIVVVVCEVVLLRGRFLRQPWDASAASNIPHLLFVHAQLVLVLLITGLASGKRIFVHVLGRIFVPVLRRVGARLVELLLLLILVVFYSIQLLILLMPLFAEGG